MGLDWRALKDHPTLPDGNYVGDVVNQHARQWCGCCFVIAAVQMVEDRSRITLAKTKGKSAVHHNLHWHSLMDHFEETQGGVHWNVCHGGYSLHVLECLSSKSCPMVWEAQRSDFEGFSRVVHHCAASRPWSTPVEVRHPQRIPVHRVQDELKNRGPVVLEVNGDTLKSCDEGGVVTDLTPRPPNHAVTVVGWDEDNWIVRNSWGTEAVPHAIPSDLKCVQRGRNDCQVKWQKWTGDPLHPGVVKLPMAFQPLHDTDTSPWIVAECDVQ